PQKQHRVGRHQLGDGQCENLFEWLAPIMAGRALGLAAGGPSLESPWGIDQCRAEMSARQPHKWAALETLVQLVEHHCATSAAAFFAATSRWKSSIVRRFFRVRGRAFS